MRRVLTALLALVACAPGFATAAEERFVTFESGQVRPMALSPDGSRLFAVDTPDNRLEILAPEPGGLRRVASVPVGLEPVAVAARNDGEVWVVNHLSDSVSVVDVGADPPRVVRTLLVGDEPRDIVFAGPGRDRAFITTAHRGQNIFFDPQLITGGVGRADVWVFDAAHLGGSLAGDPLTVVTLFADTPRALAVSADGAVVYAAAFHSGNRSTVIPEEAVCDGGAAAPPCAVDGYSMPGGLPAPNTDADGVPQPEVGLMAKFNEATGAWEDEIGRNWNNAARFSLPDKDVFSIDAMADPPVELRAYTGVGTILYDMAVNPVTGAVYVSNTEANNLVRFEPRVRGHLHEARITVLDDSGVHPRHLNPHIDYGLVPSPPGVAEQSLALPLGMAVSADGQRLYLCAFGSGKIAIFDAPQLEAGVLSARHLAVGGGPTGIVLDETRQQAYVLTRFDDSVAVVDVGGEEPQVVARVRLFNPEPASVVEGRRFLYDATYTSSNGEAACGACHVFGDFDSLAWDLGDPSGSVINNPNPLLNAGAHMDNKDYHPLKGPMTTQTLRGMSTHGPMHWRGDRTGGNDPGGDPSDERAAFRQFNVAFFRLMGRNGPLTAAEMDRFTDFVLQITSPPNPNRSLDNSLTPLQTAAKEFYLERSECIECHRYDPSGGQFGTAGEVAISGRATQFMKVPHFRNLYQKVGRFFGVLFQPLYDFGQAHLGDQVRGIGFTHNGTSGRIADDLESFLLVFDTELAPIVGQQATLSAADVAVAGPRVDLLLERAALQECDVVVHGVAGGELRGWYRDDDGTFAGDRAAESAWSEAALRVLALASDGGFTHTCAPPGTGRRNAIDRDGDGALDGDERAAGSDPADPASVPGVSTPTITPTVGAPTPTPTFVAEDGDANCDGHIGAADLTAIVLAIADGGEPVCGADVDADGDVDADDLDAWVALPRG